MAAADSNQPGKLRYSASFRFTHHRIVYSDVLLLQNIHLVSHLANQFFRVNDYEFDRDSLWIRLFVAYLFVLGSANTVIDMATMYQPLIAEYGVFRNRYARRKTSNLNCHCRNGKCSQELPYSCVILSSLLDQAKSYSTP